VGIDPAPFVGSYHLSAWRDQREGGDRQHHTEAADSVGVAEERAFQVKALGLIVQAVLLNVNAPAVLAEGLPAGGFLTDHVPALPVTRGPG